MGAAAQEEMKAEEPWPQENIVSQPEPTQRPLSELLQSKLNKLNEVPEDPLPVKQVTAETVRKSEQRAQAAKQTMTYKGRMAALTGQLGQALKVRNKKKRGRRQTSMGSETETESEDED